MIRLPAADRIGPALDEIRRLLGITQQQLAEDSGVWPSQLSHWKTGDRQPDLASLVKVAGGLGYQLALVPKEDA